jgi:hypothetical protein
MRRRSASWHAWATLVALVAPFAACRHDEVSHCFSADSDTVAMAAIESAWSEAGGLSLTLCEDVARSDASPQDGCVVDHVVRGAGAGQDQCTSHPDGCGAGGCPYENVAYVRGTAGGSPISGAVAVSGRVDLQWGYADDPYAYPYRLELSCDDPGAPCSINGTLESDGRVDVALTIGPPGSGSETHHVLDRTGAATCP